MRLFIYPTKDDFIDFEENPLELKKLDFKEMESQEMVKYNLEWHITEGDFFWIAEFKTLEELQRFVKDCPHPLIFNISIWDNWERFNSKVKKLYKDCMLVELYNDYRE